MEIARPNVPNYKTIEEVKAFYDGLSYGIWLYAYWKDGVQYVGSCGRTLKEALEEIGRDTLSKLSKITKIQDEKDLEQRLRRLNQR